MTPRLPLAAAAAVAALLASASAATAAVSPPPPTGASPVGLQRLTLVDHHRTERLAVPRGGARVVPLRVWYPAAAPGPRPAAVLTPTEQTAYEEMFGLAGGALDGLGAPATGQAAPAPGRHPVLLMSHGGGATAAFHASQAADLASHGYVVVGIDHPGDSIGVDAGGGRLLGMDPEAKGDGVRPAPIRVADMRLVLDRLTAIKGAGALDLSRIGAFGHSAGGAASASTMLADRRIDAGVDIDGGLHGPVMRRGLDRPFGMVLGDTAELPGFGDVMRAFRERVRAPHPYRHVPGAGHHAFTDELWLVPQLALDTATAELGTVDAAAEVPAQRAWLLRFFDRYVEGR